MSEKSRTISSILEALNSAVSAKTMMKPELWEDAAFYLSILIHEEEEKLFKIQQEYYQLEDKETELAGVSAVGKTRARASDKFREYKTQEARVKNVKRFIRIAEHRAKPY